MITVARMGGHIVEWRKGQKLNNVLIHDTNARTKRIVHVWFALPVITDASDNGKNQSIFQGSMQKSKHARQQHYKQDRVSIPHNATIEHSGTNRITLAAGLSFVVDNGWQ